MMNDPYAEGYDAFVRGLSETDNPYDPVLEDEEHLSWNDGYAAAEEREGGA